MTNAELATEVNNLLGMLEDFGVVELVTEKFYEQHQNTAPTILLRRQIGKLQAWLNSRDFGPTPAAPDLASSTPLFNFYKGAGTDNVGRVFDDIVAMSDAALDASHDWVQWVFPTDEPSNFNEAAPLLTDEDVASIRTHPQACVNYERAIYRFLLYLGLDQKPLIVGAIGPGENFPDRQPVVWHEFNHNYLRVTRFLRSMVLMGEKERSQKVFKCLMDLAATKQIAMSENTRLHWLKTQE